MTRHLQVGTFPQSDEDLAAYFEVCRNSKSIIFFAVVETETQRHIGNAQLYDINWVTRTAYRGIVLGEKSTWGKGYALEIIHLLHTYAFDSLNLNKVVSLVSSANLAIEKLNLKSGYTKEGVGRQELYRDGKYFDRISWGLLRSDYIALRKDRMA